MQVTFRPPCCAGGLGGGNTALRKPIASPIPAVDVFRERCEARSILVDACLLEAVDVLQADAERTGLLDDIAWMLDGRSLQLVPRPPKTKSHCGTGFSTAEGAAGLISIWSLV